MTAFRPDVVIVGGGSAGSALAARLSEDPDRNVLLLEAGRFDSLWDVLVHMPAALPFPNGSPFYDWRLKSDPEPYMHGRRIPQARGKILGGSSSINGMIFQRGNPLDYDHWAQAPGMERWSYAHCLPYFKRMESCTAGADAYRGGDGPLWLERGPATNPLFQAFLRAAEEAGYERSDDVNGYKQEGFAPFDRNIKRGRRWSASRAYLHPVLDRPNLRVQTRAFVTKVLMDGARAVGVEVVHGGRSERILADRVVLSLGAIHTPQLLQLSGIGPADHLRSLGLPVVADLPGVGENLQDHLEAYVQHAASKPVSMQPWLSWWRSPLVGAQWLFLRSGPGATNHFEAGGFVRSNDTVDHPNLMFHFLPLAVRYDGGRPVKGHGYQAHVGPMFSDARGRIRITSTDPAAPPSMRFNYLSTEQDRREWVEAIRTTREILAQPALAAFDAGEISPGPAVQSDQEILDWVARDAETALHPSCTAKMGAASDPMAVVDPDTFGVHGVEGLHVVDASVMPDITNANIYAPVMMIAERASDVLRGLPLAPPSDAPVYHHPRGSR